MNIKNQLIIYTFIFLSFRLVAQNKCNLKDKMTSAISPESSVQQNFQGKNFEQLKHTWKAQWITHPTASSLDYGVFLFRHSFNLDEKPKEFIIFVSADNRYRLYVNGENVCFGPAAGDLTHYRYETIDIADYLNKGKNIIAAEVVNFGEYKNVSQISFQTAFILQADRKLDIDINTGSANWKVFQNQAFLPVVITSEMLNAYYAAGPCDKLNAEKYPWGWNNLYFNDEDWLKPKKALTEFAVGRGFLYGGAWFLVPRDIPFMEQKIELFKKIARTENIEVEQDFLSGKQPAIIPPHKKVKILIDQTYHTTGYPELIFSKGKNSKIKITYAEALINKSLNKTNLTDGNLMLIDLKGNRNDISNKDILGYYDIIFPDGGDKRLFIPLSKRTYRFIELEIETLDYELIIEKYYGVYTVYPFKEKAKFNIQDTLLKKIWEISWRTLRNSADEMFIDPYYEQLQYIGDTKIESLISVYISGDDHLMRKAIKQFDDSRLPDGLTQSRYPSNIVQIIPPYSLIWVDMIYDYLMYRDNPEFLYQFIPGIRSVLNWFYQRVDSNNMMLKKLEWWNFTDWTSEFPNGIPPGADNNYSANITLQYVKTLQNAEKIFRFFNLKQEADEYKLLADKIKKSVFNLCYDKDKKLIAETPIKKQFSQHTNIWAILTDTYKENKQAGVMHKLLQDTSIYQATLYFRFYLFRALQKSGLGDKYIDLLEPWETMIKNGMTTFGETDINPRSECHAWSASPSFDFLHLIAGIYPSSPSFKTVIIEPNLGKIKNLYVEFPHPKGNITIIYSKENNKLNAQIKFPKNLKGVFKWKGKKVKLKSGLQKISL